MFSYSLQNIIFYELGGTVKDFFLKSLSYNHSIQIHYRKILNST